MEVWKLILLGVVIGSNNLAVAFGLGALNIRAYWWRVVLIFGLFEFFIPLVGISIGRKFSSYIADYASIVGGTLLVLFGLFLIYKTLRTSTNQEQRLINRIKSWTGIISLSAGLSLDNLIVGFSIGLQDVHPLTVATVIAFSSILFTLIGLNFGKYLKARFRTWTDIGTAALLLLLGFATWLEWL